MRIKQTQTPKKKYIFTVKHIKYNTNPKRAAPAVDVITIRLFLLLSELEHAIPLSLTAFAHPRPSQNASSMRPRGMNGAIVVTNQHAQTDTPCTPAQ